MVVHTSARPSEPVSIPYRPEIDGLRAIAIVGVVLVHAFPSTLSGGFVGVDVFFVISGFLITSIVRRQTLEGRFSLSGFYEHRIRRLLPALFLVLLVTSLACLIVLPPEDLRQYGRSLIPCIEFQANFFFRGRGSYFDPPTVVRPLLHLWSLGIEEQFYLVWPLVLLLGRRLPNLALAAIMAAVALTSLIADQLALAHDPLNAFYSTPLRIWEPLLGALLATLAPGGERRQAPAQALSLAGSALIIGSMLLISGRTPFPGLAAAPACLGAALIIQGRGGSGGVWVGRLLSTKPMLWLGSISYSLYLWHWPVLTLFRLGRLSDPAWPVMAMGVAISLGLSYLTLRLVEERYRRRPLKGLSRRGVFGAGLAVLVFFVLCGQLFMADQGLSSRAHGLAAEAGIAEEDAGRWWYSCHEELNSSKPACQIGAKHNGAPAFIVWGDSFALAWAPALDDWARQRGLSGQVVSQESCPPSLGIEGHKPNGDVTPCRGGNAALVDLVRRSPDLKLVVLTARWNMYDIGAPEGNSRYITLPGRPRDPSAYHAILAAGVGRLIEALEQARGPSLHIVILGPLADYAVSPPRCAAEAAFVGRDVTHCIHIDAGEIAARDGGSTQILKDLASRYANITLIDPNAALCNTAYCTAYPAGQFAYMDVTHLTRTAARRIGHSLFAALN